MTPIILAANTTVFPSAGANGLGRLSDCYSCLVTEEINSTYTLTAKCQADSLHADLCVEGNYLYTTHDASGDLQPFEIRRVKRKSDGSMEIYAEHISYKLTRMSAGPFGPEASLTATMAAISSNLEPTNSFTFAADFTSEVSFELKHPMSARALLNGEQGSIVDVYGQGEWQFDKWACTLKQMRGADNGARIRSGHNLTSLLIDSQGKNGYKAIYPYYFDSFSGTLRQAANSDTGRVVMLDPDPAPDVGDDVIAVDMTLEFTEVPTEARVRQKAIKWLEDKKPWVSDPVITVKYSAVVDDSASEVVLGDAVTVIDKKLNYNAKHRIVKTVWNVLYDRYDSVGVGKLSPTLYDLIRKVAK